MSSFVKRGGVLGLRAWGLVAIVLLRGLENLGFVTLRGVVVSDVTDTTATPCVNAAVDLVAQVVGEFTTRVCAWVHVCVKFISTYV